MVIILVGLTMIFFWTTLVMGYYFYKTFAITKKLETRAGIQNEYINILEEEINNLKDKTIHDFASNRFSNDEQL